jgi:hypothetical protein
MCCELSNIPGMYSYIWRLVDVCVYGTFCMYLHICLYAMDVYLSRCNRCMYICACARLIRVFVLVFDACMCMCTWQVRMCEYKDMNIHIYVCIHVCMQTTHEHTHVHM